MATGMDLHLDKICRTCLQIKKDMRPLFSELIAEMLTACASIQVGESDGLPMQLCLQCVHQVSRCYTFKQQVERSDYKLREYVGLHPDKATTVSPPEEIEEIVSSVDPVIEFSYIEGNDSCNNANGSEGSVNDATTLNSSNDVSSANISGEDTPLGTYYISASGQDDDGGNLIQIQSESIKKDKDVESHKEHRTDAEILASLTCEDEDDEEKYFAAGFQPSASIGPGRHVCNLCHKEFKYVKILNQHMKLHSNWIKANCKKPPTCNLCGRSFKGEGMLKLHMKTHEIKPQKSPTCTICQRQFKTKTILYRHRQTHFEQKTHPCNICDKSFISNYALKAHLARHRGEKTHACVACGKTFYNATDLKVHIRLHTGEKPLTCPDCSKTFRRHSTLCQHIKKHRGIKDHICQVCKKGFFEMSKLKAHMRVHTGEKPYSCQFCSRSFAQQSALIYHKRTHTGEKPYCCKVCEAKFTTSSARNNHMLTHTGVKRFTCGVCHKGCNSRTELRVHMTKHTGEKLFPCSECNQRFATASYLSVHKRHHTGEKKYTCPTCNKGFVESGAFRKHLKIHPKEEMEASMQNEGGNSDGNVNDEMTSPPQPLQTKTFQCTLCPKSYTQGQNLKKHMMTHGVLNQATAVALVTSNSQQPQQVTVVTQPQQQTQHQVIQQQVIQQQLVQQQPQQQLQVQAIQIHPQHVTGQPIQIHAVGVHQVQQQQVHVATSGCQPVQIPNIVQVQPAHVAVAGLQQHELSAVSVGGVAHRIILQPQPPMYLHH